MPFYGYVISHLNNHEYLRCAWRVLLQAKLQEASLHIYMYQIIFQGKIWEVELQGQKMCSCKTVSHAAKLASQSPG